MKDLHAFERDYILQTRAEIDTEKKERDTLLNIAVGLLGIAAFGMWQNGKIDDVLRNEFTKTASVCVLLIITSLMWIRRKKLQQITDRWFVLRELIQSAKKQPDQRLLEDIVCEGLKKNTYSIKDTIVCLTLSLPMYCFLIRWPLGYLIILDHAFLCFLIFIPPLKNRMHPESRITFWNVKPLDFLRICTNKWHEMGKSLKSKPPQKLT